MRTTLTLDDDLAMELQAKARDEGRTFKDVVNEAIRRGLSDDATAPDLPYRAKPWNMGVPNMDLTKVSHIVGAWDEERYLRITRELEVSRGEDSTQPRGDA